ncbi:probable receptor-like protein kinase At1g11050 isoform X2 [Cornus florida]|uniref:probable receptor-like protein kinase At1g11050 isoform X2 n=1 Tax=Cornus florida TaxID=4283 RepID=UPI002899C1A5|nr:probable receptor-like protein kinase At1g11050 isoform X2 [Cornus florida]
MDSDGILRLSYSGQHSTNNKREERRNNNCVSNCCDSCDKSHNLHIRERDMKLDLVFLSLLSLSILVTPAGASAPPPPTSTNISTTCPMDFGYVLGIPWSSSPCLNSKKTDCCHTLLGLFGIALSQRLKQTSLFHLPNLPTSISCLSDFQSKLDSLSLPSNLTSLCFDPLQFVITPNICAAVESTQDWVAKLGPSTPIDTACRTDLTVLTSCEACVTALLQVQSKLIEIDGNKSHSTDCFHFSILYAAGIVNEFGPESNGTMTCILGLSLTTKNQPGSMKDWWWWWIGSLIAIIPTLFGFLCYLRKRNLKQKQQTEDREKCHDGADKLNFSTTKPQHLQLYSFLQIAAATDNFSSVNKLGQGGFGPVYKGVLSDGHHIAIKRLSRSSGQGIVEFKNEITLIAELQHMNLVKLLGCCIQGEEKMLIYEYMPNKSLDFFLFDPTKSKLLDWKKRLNIIEGIAQGLLYLHKYSRMRVIHRDLKASNVLLDDEMNPKISDFGLARIFGQNENEANTNRVVGTYGYMSPEYAMNGIFSVKSDVYSFGVLLLEIVSGKKNTSFSRLAGPLSLIEHVKYGICGRKVSVLS